MKIERIKQMIKRKGWKVSSSYDESGNLVMEVRWRNGNLVGYFYSWNELYENKLRTERDRLFFIP